MIGVLARFASFLNKGAAFVPTGPLTEIDFDNEEDLRRFCFVMGVDIESMRSGERPTAQSDGMLVLDGMGTLPTEFTPLVGLGSKGMTTVKTLAPLAKSWSKQRERMGQGFIVSDYRKFKGRWGK